MTKNFKKQEFLCKGDICGRCQMPDEIYYNIIKTANQLQTLRNKIGLPIRVTSGYRCEEWNEKVGGVSNSRHKIGKAADIQVDGVSPLQIYKTINELIDNGDMLQGGVGVYDTFVHYDYRGTRTRWNKISKPKKKKSKAKK